MDYPLPSEVLYMFAAWLVSLEEPVTLGINHNAAIAADLVQEFCDANNFPFPRNGFEKLMEHPITRKTVKFIWEML